MWKGFPQFDLKQFYAHVDGNQFCNFWWFFSVYIHPYSCYSIIFMFSQEFKAYLLWLSFLCLTPILSRFASKQWFKGKRYWQLNYTLYSLSALIFTSHWLMQGNSTLELNVNVEDLINSDMRMNSERPNIYHSFCLYLPISLVITMTVLVRNREFLFLFPFFGFLSPIFLHPCFFSFLHNRKYRIS